MRTIYTTYDYYKILDCHQNASQDHIKAQFRKMAFKYHPDSHINENLSEAKKESLSKQFNLIKEAYDALSSFTAKEIEQVPEKKETVKEEEEVLTPE